MFDNMIDIDYIKQLPLEGRSRENIPVNLKIKKFLCPSGGGTMWFDSHGLEFEGITYNCKLLPTGTAYIKDTHSFLDASFFQKQNGAPHVQTHQPCFQAGFLRVIMRIIVRIEVKRMLQAR